jgi:hypothetical protein
VVVEDDDMVLGELENRVNRWSARLAQRRGQ